MVGSKVELVLEQATPALIGSAEPAEIDEAFFLRPSSLKGIWRWTARALVGGVLYELGYLCGKDGRDVLCVPGKREVEAVSLIVGDDMGLGYAGWRKSKSSLFRLLILVERTPKVYKTMRGGKVRVDSGSFDLQRVRLLTLGGPASYFVGGRFRVIVELRAESMSKGLELGLRTLILALTIMCLGKGSRRALGCFDVISVKGLSIETNLRSFLNATYDLALEVVKTSRHLAVLHGRAPMACRERLPPFPVLTRAELRGLNVSRLYAIRSAGWIDVHNFFVRTERCKKLMKKLTDRKVTDKHVCMDDLRRKWQAWILGLPRGRPGSGYAVIGGPSRRASPFVVSYHTENHVLGNGVFVTVLASCDWPRKIVWRGTGVKEFSIDEVKVINALETALRELLQYVGAPDLTPLWP